MVFHLLVMSIHLFVEAMYTWTMKLFTTGDFYNKLKFLLIRCNTMKCLALRFQMALQLLQKRN